MDTKPYGHIANSNSTSMDAIRFIESGQYSDLTISCHGREFKVHKAILCPQSEVIAKLCDIAMKERHTGMIEHQEFDEATMERMVDFAYKRNYGVTRRPKGLASEVIRDLVGSEVNEDGVIITKGEHNKLSAPDLWVIHARVYGLADYYDMMELRDHAYGCFMGVVDDEWEDVIMDGFIDVVREVSKRTTPYNSLTSNPSNHSLRAGFLALVSTYASKLGADSSFIAALCDPALKDIAVEIFCALGQRMVRLEEEKREMASSFEIERHSFRQSLSNFKVDRDLMVTSAQRAQKSAEQRLKHAENEMLGLITSLETLPASCGMRRCSNKFGSLNFERGPEGNWEMRCGAGLCSYRLH